MYELFHILLIKIGAGLLAVGVNITNIQLSKLGAGNRDQTAPLFGSRLRGGNIFTKEEVHRTTSQGGIAQCRAHVHTGFLLRCFT